MILYFRSEESTFIPLLPKNCDPADSQITQEENLLYSSPLYQKSH